MLYLLYSNEHLPAMFPLLVNNEDAVRSQRLLVDQ
jgi:hypothetical protein